MKTTDIILVSVFMVASAIKTSAQGVSGRGTDPKSSYSKTDATRVRDAQAMLSGGGMPGEKFKLTGVEGQIYIGSDWPAGSVVLHDGSRIDDYLLRYDIMADQMQFISGKDTLAFASPKELSTVSFDGHTFIYETFQCENTIRQGYFELIEPGKNKLLLKRLVTYEVPDVKEPEDRSTTKYYIDECFFISKPDKLASKVMCNRKSVLSLLNEHNAEIDEYLRITGNKVKTTEDLKKVVACYNALDETK